jgi:hypothetical protein
MNDDSLVNAWNTLAPSPSQRRRIDARVSAWLDARDLSLFAEWTALIKIHPLAMLGATALAACYIAVATPLRWLAYSVL